MLVKDFLFRQGRRGDVGLELEVEANKGLPTLDNDLWRTTNEGSLRGPFMAEYVSKGPLTIPEASRAIGQISRELHKELYDVIRDSPRTSFHVHCNQLYATPVQFWTSATCYWLLENILFDYCSDHRKGNHFCLRLRDAEGVIGHALTDLRGTLPFQALSGDSLRYGGQNIAAVCKYGTLEYRGMDGTIEGSRLDTWTTELHQLNNKTKEFDNPEALMNYYFQVEPSIFIRRFFSPFFAGKLIATKDYGDQLFENSGILCELAYFHDWKKWENDINTTLGKYKKEGITYDYAARYDEELERDDPSLDVPVQQQEPGGTSPEGSSRNPVRSSFWNPDAITIRGGELGVRVPSPASQGLSSNQSGGSSPDLNQQAVNVQGTRW